jgi:hypothetical protein
MPNCENTGSLMVRIRVAEIESILLCICLPMMPAFSRLVLQGMRRMFQVSDQTLNLYQRFRGRKRTSLNHNILAIYT